MTIKYYTKSVYGNELIYLADSDQAYQWRKLTGKKTIDFNDMNVLKNLFNIKLERTFEPSETLV